MHPKRRRKERGSLERQRTGQGKPGAVAPSTRFFDRLEAGELLLGKYRVERILGHGGMAGVVRAHHVDLHLPVAIKLLLPEVASPVLTRRFLREARAVARLTSEHVCRVHDVGLLGDGLPYMVMEHLEGKTLAEMLRPRTRSNVARKRGGCAPKTVCDLALQACEALAEAHSRGIVHRDIKPSNLFVTRGLDGSPLLKVLDFGISKVLCNENEPSQAPLTASIATLGTPPYMAPEQITSSKRVDARTDVWSLGVVLYEVLSGRPPFRADTWPQLFSDIALAPVPPMRVALPGALEAVITRCLEKEPCNRYQDVGELATALVPFTSSPAAATLSAVRTARILEVRLSA